MLDSKAGVIRGRVYTVDAGDWCLYDLQRRRAAAVLDTGRSEGTGHQRLGLFSRGTMSPLPWCSTALCSQLGSPETKKTGGGSIRGTVGGSSRPPKSCAPDRLSLFKTPGRVRYRWVQAWRRQGAHPGFHGAHAAPSGRGRRRCGLMRTVDQPGAASMTLSASVGRLGTCHGLLRRLGGRWLFQRPGLPCSRSEQPPCAPAGRSCNHGDPPGPQEVH